MIPHLKIVLTEGNSGPTKESFLEHTPYAASLDDKGLKPIASSRFGYILRKPWNTGNVITYADNNKRKSRCVTLTISVQAPTLTQIQRTVISR